MSIQRFISTLSLSNSPDHYEWWPDNVKKTKYKVSDIYLLLREQGPVVPWHREVWFSGGIPRQKFLTWLMVLNRSPTRDRLISWGLQTPSVCLLCNSQPESRSHLFFDCSFSWLTWNPLVSKILQTPARIWDSLLLQLRNFVGPKPRRRVLLLLWQATIYHLWSITGIIGTPSNLHGESAKILICR